MFTFPCASPETEQGMLYGTEEQLHKRKSSNMFLNSNMDVICQDNRIRSEKVCNVLT